MINRTDSPDASAADADADLTARFEAACRRASARYANRQAAEQAAARLDALSQDAERLAAAETFDEAGWKQLTGEWSSSVGQADGLDAAVSQRFADAEVKVAQRAAERQAAEERLVRQQVQRIEQLIERAHARAAAEDLTLREADRIVRDLRTAIDAPAATPGAPHIPDRERHDLIERLKAALAVVAPRLHDLREMDEWKRFANAAVQEELIAQTEALRAKYHLDAEGVRRPTTSRRRRASSTTSRSAGSRSPRRRAPRRRRCGIATARPPIRSRPRRASSSLPAPRSARAISIARCALIERAEALADSTDWIKTADELKKLQLEWQQIGPVPRHDTRATWKRFREACDKFFTRRNADLAERKETWSANLDEEGSALRARRGARQPHATGTGRPARSAACRASGRPSARSAATSRRRSGSASAPRATRSSIATSGATRSSSRRSRPIAKS